MVANRFALKTDIASLRPGLTRIEVIAIFVSLVGLFCFVVPLLTSSTVPRGRNECQNNLKQIYIATMSFTTSKARYPGYLQVERLLSESAMLKDHFPQTAEADIQLSWAAVLLPYLDQQSLWEEITTNSEFDPLRPPQMEFFECYAIPKSNSRAPTLSYVANTGMPDLEEVGAGSFRDLKANGIFHDLRPGSYGPLWTGSYIKDGSKTTLMFSENVHRDHDWDRKDGGRSWLAPAPNSINNEQWYGMVWVYDPSNPLEPSPKLIDRLSQDTRAEQDKKNPYSKAGSRFARPASNHPGVFVVAFAGGAVKAISNEIDYRVYQQLLTPNGAKAADLRNPDADMGVFMEKGLNDADY